MDFSGLENGANRHERAQLATFSNNATWRVDAFARIVLFRHKFEWNSFFPPSRKIEKRVSIRSIEFLSRFFLETTSPFSFGSRERHDRVVSR